MRQGATLLAALALVIGGAPAAAVAATQIQGSSATLPDIEDEVMCTICGTTLQLSNSPQANRERVFINELISQGKDKEQIKDALVEEYGSEVLAVPSTEGFDLTAWVVPLLAASIALVALVLAALRWRRATATADGDPPLGGEVDPADEERLRSDLRRYEI
ncbi:MAG: cytochrome c-type biogenesis protein CcmH [Solirubrobacterales bacterium]|nr:cytochrome c-type biogenesis protein CcmH [Solirubrobacterales bacterium]